MPPGAPGPHQPVAGGLSQADPEGQLQQLGQDNLGESHVELQTGVKFIYFFNVYSRTITIRIQTKKLQHQKIKF